MKRLLAVLGLLAAGCALAQPAPDWSNPVKKTLNSGGVVVGATITVANLDTMSVMGNAGFDFLWIEGEHSPLTLETTRDMILATRGLKAIPFTRVPTNELWTAKRVLDIGSLGVIFPFTNNPALARQAVMACKYPPAGDRGSGPSFASLRWSPPGGYAQWANDNVMVIIIIERKEAIDKIEEIAAVPGIDVMFIGLNDLSYSLGVPGKIESPVVKEAVKKVMAAAKKHNIPVGGPGMSPSVIKGMLAEGYRFIQGPSDLSFVQSGSRTFFENLKKEGVDKKEPVGFY